MDAREVIRGIAVHIKNQGYDKEFAKIIFTIVSLDEHREQLLEYLNSNSDKQLTTTDIMMQAIDITRKADLVEGEFYKINPDLKK